MSQRTEDEWLEVIEKRQKEVEEYKINNFLNRLDVSQLELGLSSLTFENLPKEVQMFIIKIFNKCEDLEYQIDEIRSICG